MGRPALSASEQLGPDEKRNLPSARLEMLISVPLRSWNMWANIQPLQMGVQLKRRVWLDAGQRRAGLMAALMGGNESTRGLMGDVGRAAGANFCQAQRKPLKLIDIC